MTKVCVGCGVPPDEEDPMFQTETPASLDLCRSCLKAIFEDAILAEDVYDEQ